MIKTRFQQEISGDLGDFWKKKATNQVKEYVEKANTDAVVDEDGAIKWKSTSKYLIDDFCEVLEYAKYPFSREATKLKRDKQNDAFLKEYRANPPKLTLEERNEMVSAFGYGTKVVDIITGEEILL